MAEQEQFEADATAPYHSDSLVLEEDDDSGLEQDGSMHVRFAHSQATHHTGSPVPDHPDPSRSKRGSFFPGHGLASSTSAPTGLSKALSWTHHTSLQHHSTMPSHHEGNSDSSDTPEPGAICWNLSSQPHFSSVHPRPQKAAKPRGNISPSRSRSPSRGSRVSSSSTSSERRQGSDRRYLAAHGYQPHTLEEFRAQGYDAKRERYWALGTLGTDLDTVELQRKRDKADRIKHLSQNIRERNQALAEVSSGKQSQSARPIAPEQSSVSIRERMQEYARTVQKAAAHNRLPSPKRIRGSQQRPLHADSNLSGAQDEYHALDREAIVELEMLHTRQRIEVEQMRKELVENLEGLKLAPV